MSIDVQDMFSSAETDMQRIIDPTTIKRTRLAVNTDAGTRASEDRQPAPDSPPAAKQIRGPLPRRHSPAPEPRALSDRNDEPGALSTLDRLTLPGLSALPTAAASLSPISYTERPSLAQVMKQGRGSSRRQRPVRQQTAASRPLLGGYPIITTPLIPALPLMASAPPSGPADKHRSAPEAPANPVPPLFLSKPPPAAPPASTTAAAPDRQKMVDVFKMAFPAPTPACTPPLGSILQALPTPMPSLHPFSAFTPHNCTAAPRWPAGAFAAAEPTDIGFARNAAPSLALWPAAQPWSAGLPTLGERTDSDCSDVDMVDIMHLFGDDAAAQQTPAQDVEMVDWFDDGPPPCLSYAPATGGFAQPPPLEDVYMEDAFAWEDKYAWGVR